LYEEPPPDTPETHWKRRVASGPRGSTLSNQELTKIVFFEGYEASRELEEMGMYWRRTDEGKLMMMTGGAEQVWLDFLTKSELGLEEPENPVIGAILTFLSFIGGAFITLFPYFLNLDLISLILSSIISFGMLFIVGMLKTLITGEHKIKSGIEMVLIGVIAFIISYGIGTLLDQLISTT